MSANNKWIEWKWTFGPKYEKSARTRQQVQMDDKMPELAIQQSLLSEGDVWSLEEQQVFIKPLNKREDTYNRMATREMIGQIGMNPFSNNNYLNDVMVQDSFLKPVSTSMEREERVSEKETN